MVMRAGGAGSLRTGSCQCGGVRYECPAEPVALYACHCAGCRRQSGSAFGMSFEIPDGALRLLGGAPRLWTRPTDSGRTLECAFCPDCGTRLWHRSVEGGWMTVKAGTLDEPVDFAGAVHIWTERRLPGVEIPPGARRFAREPEA